MKFIKQYEKIKSALSLARNKSLIGFPKDDEIIMVTQEEFELLPMVNDFLILWKLDRLRFRQGGSWTYQDDDKEDIKNWLNIYRDTGDSTLASELCSNLRKYNL